MQRRRLGHSIKKHLVRVTMFESELEIALERFAVCTRLAERAKQFPPRFQAERAQNVVAVAVPFVDRRRRRAGGFGNCPHGQSFFATARPQSRGRTENTLFQVWVGMPGHFCLLIPQHDTAKLLLELRITNTVYYIYNKY